MSLELEMKRGFMRDYTCPPLPPSASVPALADEAADCPGRCPGPGPAGLGGATPNPPPFLLGSISTRPGRKSAAVVVGPARV